MGERRMALSDHPLLPPKWRSPSCEEGMDRMDEDLERYLGCTWIDKLIGYFNGHHDVPATKPFIERTRVQCCAHYYFHAFYNYTSFVTQDKGVVALSCILLASKVLEDSRNVKEIVKSYVAVIANTHPRLELIEREQAELREEIVKIESFLLRILSFNFSPPTQCFDALERLINGLFQAAAEKIPLTNGVDPSYDMEWKKSVMICAKSFLCDSYRGLVVHVHSHEVLALTCLKLSLDFHRNTFSFISILLQQWHTIFPTKADVELEMQQAKAAITKLYQIKKKLVEPHRSETLMLPEQSLFKKWPTSPSTVPSTSPPSAGRLPPSRQWSAPETKRIKISDPSFC